MRFDIDTEYLRPSVLATDSAGKLEVIADVKRYAEKKYGVIFEYILDLDITSPLRTLQDLVGAFDCLKKDARAYNIFSVNPSSRNPYFNMVEKNVNGYYETSKKGLFLTRQSAPEVYDMNASFYFYRESYFRENYKSAISERSLVYVMPHICFDLDHPIDFEILEFLLTHNKIDFEI